MGAAVLFGGIIAVALMDVCGKLLSADMAVAQVSWARFFFHFIILSPLALIMVMRGGARVYVAAAKDWRWHLLRGALIAASSMAFFGAIQHNPVPDALAVFFIEPLFVAILARWLLGEKTGGRIVAACIVGFGGVLIILRPGGGDYHWTITFAPMAALFFAGYIVSARAASLSSPPLATSWYSAFFAMLLSMPMALWLWTPPTMELWMAMMTLGLLAAAGHTLIILSCRYAPASQLAVLHYSEVAVAVIISWFVFAHIPGKWFWAGAALIFTAKLLALTRRKN